MENYTDSIATEVTNEMQNLLTQRFDKHYRYLENNGSSTEVAAIYRYIEKDLKELTPLFKEKVNTLLNKKFTS